jgi:hypothetical protein
MVAPLTFPYGTLKASAFTLDLLGNVIAGGVTNGGYQQRVNTSGGGLWGLKLDFTRFHTADQLRAWRVIQYGSNGGTRAVNVAICDLRQAPRPTGSSGGGVPHSDETPFSDGSLYSSPQIIATLSASAAIGATSVSVEFDGDSQPLGGEFFSLSYGDGYHELHVVIGVVETVGGFTLTFVPPLRAAHSSGEVVEFDHPTGTFVLADPNAMSMATEFGRWGRGAATFIEYLGGM